MLHQTQTLMTLPTATAQMQIDVSGGVFHRADNVWRPRQISGMEVA